MVATWNVKGLTEEKLFSIYTIMHDLRIGVLCLQDTRALKADYYSENGYRVILSGSEETQRRWAGVGFVIAP